MDKFFGKSRKKVILICSIVIAIIIFTGYFSYKKMIGDDKVQIPSYDVITKINFDFICSGRYDGYEFSDKEDIETIVDFLNGIKTTKVKNPDAFYGGLGYHLEFHTQDDQIVNIALAEPILTVDGKEWEVSHEEVLRFDRIMAEIIYKRYHNDVSYTCLKGTVKKIYNEDTYTKDVLGGELLSRKRMCVIDTDNKKIDVSYSYIFDFKKNEIFSGPKKGDQVEIYLKAGEENAKAVFSGLNSLEVNEKNDSMNPVKTEKAGEQFDNPIDSYFLPLLDGSNYRTAAEYRNLQEIYGTVWQLEYKNLVLWLLSKCEFEEDRKNIEQFDNCVKEYIDATMSVIKTEKMDSYSFSPGDSSRIGGTGTYGWMKYMEGKIYRDVCMFTIGVNDSDFSKYEFVNRDYSKLSMGSLYEELR